MNKQAAQFVLCVQNRGYPASLEVRKVYRVRAERGVSAHGLIRVVDESGEAYFYPESYFVPIEIPESAQAALSAFR